MDGRTRISVLRNQTVYGARDMIVDLIAENESEVRYAIATNDREYLKKLVGQWLCENASVSLEV